jgi:hypothetical protein
MPWHLRIILIQVTREAPIPNLSKQLGKALRSLADQTDPAPKVSEADYMNPVEIEEAISALAEQGPRQASGSGCADEGGDEARV